MEFDLTDAQLSLRSMVREFAAKEIAPRADEFENLGAIPGDLIRRMASLGLLGICVPTAYGGAGMDCLAYILALEEVCRASAAVGLMMTVNNTLYAEPLMRFGTEAQKQRWLAPAARGERLGCYCLTEPSSGSDAMALQTTATRSGDGWKLNGTKQFITNGEISSQAVVFATVDRSKGHRGVTAFLVDKAAPGFRVVKKERKMGLLASDTCQLAFDDVQVPDDQVLGEVGAGYRVAFSTLDAGRIGIAAQALGIADACFEAATAYARQRRQFGEPIANFQAVQWMVADMATEIEAARWLTYRAAALKDSGERSFSTEASMAKLYASEMGTRVAYRAVQIHGGSGYMKDFPVERYFRDARAIPLYEGASEIQRMVIARQLLKESAQ